MAVLKVRTKDFRGKPVIEYLPTWRIAKVVAEKDFLEIHYDSIVGDEDGVGTDYVLVRLDFLRNKKDEEGLTLVEALAEKIVELMADRSYRIVDLDELLAEIRIVS